MSAPEHDHGTPAELPPMGGIGGLLRSFFGLFDNPKNVTRLCWGLAVTCVVLVVIGELIHKHGHFEVEYTVPAFYGLFGFIAYCCIIGTAILLRKVVMRPEDYYDE
jgi:hypothetical protein